MWLLCLGVAPISEPRVLDDPPEALIRHARGRRRVEEPRGDYGGLGPVTRPPAREQRPEAEQRHIVLQHPALVAMAGEARVFEDRRSCGAAKRRNRELRWLGPAGSISDLSWLTKSMKPVFFYLCGARAPRRKHRTEITVVKPPSTTYTAAAFYSTTYRCIPIKFSPSRPPPSRTRRAAAARPGSARPARTRSPARPPPAPAARSAAGRHRRL